MPLAAHAVVKCVDARGNVSYMDVCPAGTTATPSAADDPQAPKPPPPRPEILRPEIKPTPPRAPGEPAPAVTIVPLPPPPPAAAPAPFPTLAPFVPAVPADVRVAFYDVEGSDTASLLKALRAREPGPAESTWQLAYEYRARRVRGGCAVGPVTTRLELGMTLPRWSPPQDAAPELLARWERYVNALLSRENARLERARELERALKPALGAMPAAADCAALDAAVKERYAALEGAARALTTEPDAAGPPFE